MSQDKNGETEDPKNPIDSLISLNFYLTKMLRDSDFDLT